MGVRTSTVMFAVAGAAWTLAVTVHGAPLRDTAETARQSETAGPREMPAGEGSAIIRSRCLACHGGELIDQQRLSRGGWSRELDKMSAWGAVVDESERGVLLDYLSAHFAEAVQARAPASARGSGAALVATRCLTCHDEQLIEQQRLTAAGWTREVEKMIGWGAILTDPEKAELIEYLGNRAADRIRASSPLD